MSPRVQPGTGNYLLTSAYLSRSFYVLQRALREGTSYPAFVLQSRLTQPLLSLPCSALLTHLGCTRAELIAYEQRINRKLPAEVRCELLTCSCVLLMTTDLGDL